MTTKTLIVTPRWDVDMLKIGLVSLGAVGDRGVLGWGWWLYSEHWPVVDDVPLVIHGWESTEALARAACEAALVQALLS
jgi:hypothetical protein